PDKIVFNGKEYTSPSAAGTAVTNKPCSGWTFWKFKDETGNEQLLDKLRQS
ncbi:MAG: modification methylase, partial [Candidatus Methanoperedenaceae archaeon HGW-Methanoperedenaceae-1]